MIMNGKRVLIVDDAMDIGRMISAALATVDPSLQTKVMPSAEEAVLEVARETPDLLIIDIRLPGISGLELTRKVRGNHPELKIIQISGLLEPQTKTKALEAGADAFFHKPLSMNDFLDTVSRFLGERPANPPEAASVESVEKEAEDQTAHLADILTGLRKAVGANAVGLINDRGRVVVQTGSLADASLESSLIPALMAAISAGEQVSRQLGPDPGGYVYTFKGNSSHLLAAPVRGGYLVIALLKAEKSELRMAIALDEMLSIQHELNSFFHPAEKPALPVQEAASPVMPALESPAPEKPVEPVGPAPAVPAVLQAEKPAGDKLENLIRASVRRRLKPEEIDAYWDALIAQGGTESAPGPASPDMLSYEQADRLGLVPKETPLP